MRPRTIGIALATLVLVASAYGDAAFQLGGHHHPPEENVLFKTDQVGPVLDGVTNRSDTLVQFSSTADTLMATAHRQSKVEAADGLINGITMSVRGHTFLDAIINPFRRAQANDMIVTVKMSDGSTLAFGPYGVTDGHNFLTVTTIKGEQISGVTIDSASGFRDLQQPRISGISGGMTVPEPSSMLWLGGGFLGLAYVLRRKML